MYVILSYIQLQTHLSVCYFPPPLKIDQRHSERFPALQPEPAGGWGERTDYHRRWSLLLPGPGPEPPSSWGHQAGTGVLMKTEENKASPIKALQAIGYEVELWDSPAWTLSLPCSLELEVTLFLVVRTLMSLRAWVRQHWPEPPAALRWQWGICGLSACLVHLHWKDSVNCLSAACSEFLLIRSHFAKIIPLTSWGRTSR